MSKSEYLEKELLEDFDPIFLDEMNSVALMNRVDTKFVLSRTILNKILPELREGYRALEVEGTKLSAYSTQYFDSPDYDFYLDHHNGKGKRFKVRIRQYVESDLYFLEIKKKFKGRTDKKRIRVDDFEENFNEISGDFVSRALGYEIQLEPKLMNHFDRITLVNKTEKERLTIDLNLRYSGNDNEFTYDHIVIAELKQERINRDSLFYRVMKNNGLRPNGFSKYCVGAISIQEDLKYNRFKSHLRLINKLKD